MSATEANTEIIAIASGKGGTGKTLVAASLGYALLRAGHRVLMLDFDRATGGLSLFLLGPEGMRQIKGWPSDCVLTSILESGDYSRAVSEGWPIRRSLQDPSLGQADHGVDYPAIISDKGIYGDFDRDAGHVVEKTFTPDLFRARVTKLFEAIRAGRYFDYVIADTRGGFGIESTNVCALADSYVVVTEPDFTSFHQDRNLVRLIDNTARLVQSPAVLKAIIVNKATEGEPGPRQEASFRAALEREFPIHFDDTHAVPLDADAMKAYKTHEMPFVSFPGSLFSEYTLRAFRHILSVMTQPWTEEQIKGWKDLTGDVLTAIEAKRAADAEARKEEEQREAALARIPALEGEVRRLTEQLDRERSQYQQTVALAREAQEATRIAFQRVSPATPTPGELSTPSAQAPSPAGRVASGTGSVPKGARPVILRAIVWVFLGVFVVSQGWSLANRFRGSRLDDARASLLDSAATSSVRREAFLKLVDAGESTFFRAALSSVDLSNLDLNGINLSLADLRGTVLVRTNLEKADLSDADLSGAVLVGTELRGAVMRNTRLRGVATFRDVVMTDATLSPSVIAGYPIDVYAPSGTQLDSARADRMVSLIRAAELADDVRLGLVRAPTVDSPVVQDEIWFREDGRDAGEVAQLLADVLNALTAESNGRFSTRAVPTAAPGRLIVVLPPVPTAGR